MAEEHVLSVPTPWKGTPKRRADPLGLRGIVSEIADTYVPGLTARQRDARWLTLLCKALASLPSAPKEDSYTLVSKFERGILGLSSAGNGRHLPGKRLATERWPGHYRHYAAWGSYKGLLATCGLVEEHDVWCLTAEGKSLAKLVKLDLSLDGRTSDIARLKGWDNWLPLGYDGVLENQERAILLPLLFGNDDGGRTRRNSLERMANEGQFWTSQEIGDRAKWFDRLTRSCLSVLGSALGACRPGELLDPNAVQLPVDIEEAARVTAAGWEQVDRLAASVQQCGGNPQIVETIVRWHVTASAGKRLFAETPKGFQRIAEEGASVRAAYAYRLGNLWRLGRQLCPDIAPSSFPAWAWARDDELEDGDDV